MHEDFSLRVQCTVRFKQPLVSGNIAGNLASIVTRLLDLDSQGLLRFIKLKPLGIPAKHQIIDLYQKLIHVGMELSYDVNASWGSE